MPEQPDIDLDGPRLDLLKAKLGRLFEWRCPEIVDTVGPFDRSAFEAFDKKRRTTSEACAARLRDYSDEEIAFFLDKDAPDTAGLRKAWNAFRDGEIRQLLANLPPWYAGGFGHPDHLADFEYWCKMQSFSLEELLCLSIGINPKDFDEDRIRSLRDKSRKQELWPSLQYLVDRYEQLARAFRSSHSGRKIFPTEFLEWSTRVELKSHPEFTRLLKRYNEASSEARKSVGDPGKTDQREIDSLAKLLTAIAIREYGYEPGSLRSPIPKEIADISAELGLSVSNETVLKYLRRGARFLPDGWKAE